MTALLFLDLTSIAADIRRLADQGARISSRTLAASAPSTSDDRRGTWDTVPSPATRALAVMTTAGVDLNKYR